MGRIIDLTLTLKSGMRGVEFDQAKTLEKDGWNAKTLHLYSHCGTHMDAPIHFGAGPGTVDQYPLNRLMGPAWLIDLERIAARALIEVKHLGEVAAQFKSGDSLIIKTGWSKRVDSPAYRDELPRIGLELARWCVDKKVNMLGVEPPSVADVNNKEELTAVHKILLEGNIIIVEGLANLDAIAKEKVTFMAWPLKVAGGDGAPVRALAIEE